MSKYDKTTNKYSELIGSTEITISVDDVLDECIAESDLEKEEKILERLYKELSEGVLKKSEFSYLSVLYYEYEKAKERIKNLNQRISSNNEFRIKVDEKVQEIENLLSSVSVTIE